MADPGTGGGTPGTGAAPGRTGTGGRTAPVATLAAGAVCAVVAGLSLGGRGVASAVLATAVVALFFWSGLIPLLLARWAPASAPLALVVVLTNYAVRLVLALVVLAGAARADLVDSRALGLVLIVCALTWTGAQVASLTRPGATE